MIAKPTLPWKAWLFVCTKSPLKEQMPLGILAVINAGVIIISSNMTIQDADAVLQKSSVRFPVATTTDLGIMLETKTNIILGYVYDVGQEIFNMIDASQSITNRAQNRDLMVADKERDLKILKENTPTNSNFDPRKMAEVEIWKFVAAVAIGICVGMVVGICVGVVVGVKL